MAVLTCDDVSLSTEELEKGKYVKLDDGTYAMRIVIVTDGDPLDCDDAQEQTQTLKRGATVILSPGQYALQVIDAT